MALSYGLSLNIHVIASVQSWCLLENSIVSVERLEQYMHIPSEAAEVVDGHQPTHNWPVVGQVKICDLKVNITHKNDYFFPSQLLELWKCIYNVRHCFS